MTPRTPLTHEQRRELIFRPFFIVSFGTCYPWGGTAVTDHFYDDVVGDPISKGWASRVGPSTESASSERHSTMLGFNNGSPNASPLSRG